MTATTSTSTPHDIPWLLRLESAAVFAAAIAAFGLVDGRWGLFALLLLAPDLAFVVYFFSRQAGRLVYNVVHAYLLPLLLALAGLALAQPLLLALACIWLAHIGMDRMIGYGLKIAPLGKDTHLQRV